MTDNPSSWGNYVTADTWRRIATSWETGTSQMAVVELPVACTSKMSEMGLHDASDSGLVYGSFRSESPPETIECHDSMFSGGALLAL